MSKSQVPILGFWKDVAGLAEPIRLLLEYTETPYQEKNYIFTLDYSDWLKEKFTLGLDFPNMPYYIDGDLKLTRQDVILKHLGRKLSLLGEGERDQAMVDQLAAESLDLHKEFRSHVYRKDFETLIPELMEKMTCKLKEYDDLLKKGGKKWMVGDEITIADFTTYEVLRILKAWKSDMFKELENLNKYMENFERLPTIKAYRQSPRFGRPLFSYHCQAKFDLK